jgi:hypothetical protein
MSEKEAASHENILAAHKKEASQNEKPDDLPN